MKEEIYLEKYNEKDLLANKEICLNAVEKNPDILADIPLSVMIKYPEICIKAVEKDVTLLEYVPESIKLKHPKMCMEAAVIMPVMLKEVPEAVMINNLPICIDIVKRLPGMLKYLPDSIKLDNSEICIEALKKKPEVLSYIPESIILSNVEVCVEAVKKFSASNRNYNRSLLKFVPYSIKKDNPELCINEVIRVPEALKNVPDEIKLDNMELCVDTIVLKPDLIEYLPDKAKEYMFGNLEKFNQIKSSCSFEIPKGYENIMDVFYYKMINSIGLEETEKLVNIPNIKKEDIERYGLAYAEKTKELFEGKYKLVGNTGAVIDIFRSIDLNEYSQKGRNVQFEVYKNINQLLEEGKDFQITDLVEEALKRSGLEINEKILEGINLRKNSILNGLIEKKLKDANSSLKCEIGEKIDVNSLKIPIEKIIEKKIKEEMKEKEGKYDIDSVINKISEEVEKKNEDGTYAYSPHIRERKEDITKITEDFLSQKNIESKLSKSLVEMIQDEKNKIGRGWIRKLINIPTYLSKEEVEGLEEKLGQKLEKEYELRLKEGVDKKEAYEFLANNDLPGTMSFQKIELIFSSMKSPFSEEFKKYYKLHKDEILKNPEIYTKLARIHNEFESIINDPEIKTRYESVGLTPSEIIRILDERKYDNIKRGNEKLVDLAAKSGLSQEEFEIAQDIYEVTKKREGNSIPQVKSEGSKYRGRMLRADDPLAIFVGNLTTCCQRISDVGEGAMMHSATEENGGVFIIEKINKNGDVEQIVGQSWVWRNKSRMCFDNIEINNTVKSNLSVDDQEEIMKIYEKAAKKAIDVDKNVMSGLLKKGEITQELYDKLVLTEVTVGINMYNDLDILEQKSKDGVYEDASIVLPLEKDKRYRGSASTTPWVDSAEKQVVIAKIPEKEMKEINTRKEKRNIKQVNEIEEKEIIYKNTRMVNSFVGHEIMPSQIDKVKTIEKEVYRSEQQVLNFCSGLGDIAETYNMDEEKIELVISEDGDWYFIGQENDDEYYVADLAMMGGTNSQKNGESNIEADAKMATFEIAELIYSKFIEMGEKGKTVRYEATRDTSYINTQRMLKKGLIEIVENEADKFKETDIKMNNLVIIPNVEKLKEELEKVQKTLEKLKEKGLTKVKIVDKKAKEK